MNSREFADLLVDVATLLPPAHNWVCGAASIDSWLAVDGQDTVAIDGRQLLSQQSCLHGKLVVIPGKTGHLTGSEIANQNIKEKSSCKGFTVYIPSIYSGTSDKGHDRKSFLKVLGGPLQQYILTSEERTTSL